MPRIRKKTNRYWPKEVKLRIVKRVIDDCLSTHKVTKEEDISD